jgi:hypothetical protein
MSYGVEIGYLTEMGSLNYPFINEVVPTQLRELFSDMVVTFDRTSIPSDLPHYLALTTDSWLSTSLVEWLGISSEEEQYDIVVDSVTINSGVLSFVLKYAGSLGTTGILLQTSGAGSSQSHFDWGTNPTWRVYNFQHTSGVRAKCVIDVSKLTDYTGTALGLKLTSRCVEVRPERVKQITAIDTDTDTPHSFTTDDINFTAGLNMVLNIDDSGIAEIDITTPNPIRTDHSIVMNCIPGKGQGRYKPDCTGNIFVRVINGVSVGKDGAFNLDARDCYWLEKLITFAGSPPGTNPRKGTTLPGRLVWHNDCEACVTCDDFYRAYQKLTQIHDRAKLLYNRAMSALKYYDYYRNLTETLKTFLNDTEATFTVVKENANMFTVKVTLSAGKRNIDAFDASLLLPSGFNATVKKGSGWRRLGSQTKIRPIDNDKSPVVDNHIDYPATVPATIYFGTNSVSFWQWSFYLQPASPSVGTITTQSIQFSMTMSAHEAGAGTINLGTHTRTTAITY